jgi:hypothetical protein
MSAVDLFCRLLIDAACHVSCQFGVTAKSLRFPGPWFAPRLTLHLRRTSVVFAVNILMPLLLLHAANAAASVFG